MDIQTAFSTRITEIIAALKRLYYFCNPKKAEALRIAEENKRDLMRGSEMIYFYQEGNEFVHDKDCLKVQDIPALKFRASKHKPKGKHFCPQCSRKLYLRIACDKHPEDADLCEDFLEWHPVSTKRIRHCVVDLGMKFTDVHYDRMTIEGREDTWMIRGVEGKPLELWHNNYVVTSGKDRVFTGGFHRQKIRGGSFTKVLNYIEWYSYKKHLERQNCMKETEQTGTWS